MLSDAAAREELCGRVVTDMVEELFDGHIGLVDILVDTDIPTAAEHLRLWVVFFFFERLHNFPREVGVISSKVSVCSCFQEPIIATSLEIQVDGNHSRPEVKALFHNLENLLVWNLSSDMRVNKYG